LFSSDSLASIFKQFEQNLTRLILQLQLDAVSAQLPGVRFQLKDSKAVKGTNFVRHRHA
jgi:hypothetical protein